MPNQLFVEKRDIRAIVDHLDVLMLSAKKNIDQFGELHQRTSDPYARGQVKYWKQVWSTLSWARTIALQRKTMD